MKQPISHLFHTTYRVVLTGAVLLFIACAPKEKKLPFLGNPTVENKDTIFPKIAHFEFTNQDNKVISNDTFHDKIYVADFIFLSCPTICPKMTSELMSVYKVFKANPKVLFLSHTIDPENDSIEKLKSYTEQMSIDSNWHFVTGSKADIFNIAEKSYFTTAYKDDNEPGGYVHGGGLMLIDGNGHMRGVYDGTDALETMKLINDIKTLLKEL